MELEFQNLKLEQLDKPAHFLATLIETSLEQSLFPVLLFTGTMGAGKTTFTSKLVKKISPSANVNSPTYTLINQYPISGREDFFYHFDLHRLKSSQDLEDLGFEEIWGKTGVSIIEWWQIAKEDIRNLHLKIEVDFQIVSEDERKITFKSDDVDSYPILKDLWIKMEGHPA
ncbi:tRNA (adenosine(37)-N6)-threonylcarbamoyltransferase complex ATPase subunit type 1 TsaE [Leptospira sp. 201903071]|uniref:tRNA (adenosine(37)-N6)-threonylcarbamoyltransferase complex ATPase subunit type 1 TsaE n=1 Tax=Leptospira ainazelensis TaxID=2810034 RepID=UPI0019641C0D|nr:tRNA (adenosine(37)-N6)-threonylcarbamoyltransferase complex ATPase subunit type 1 TsaE [Leptospira ainazelensis]MBM9499624.1 tRNA (adenosine(37)-N6)-threonylcarbamoyltransferase complex ATPase subunit type 1 TsaE [Leptospira ainazelensis]